MAAATKVTAKQVSFFERVKAELQKLFTHAPGWEASAAATLTYIAPLVETMVLVTDPEAAPAVTLLIQKVQSAMAAAAVVVKDAGPVPTLMTYLNAIKSNVVQIEAAANLKDPATTQKLTTLITTVAAEIDAIIAAVTPATA